MYYRRPPRKRLRNYFMPFLVIVLIFIVIIFGWRTLDKIFIDQYRDTSNENVFLNIESGSAKAMTVDKNEWQNAPDKIDLYRGERVKTGPDGRVTLTFFDQSIMRLNTSTEVAFTSLQKKKETYSIEVELVKGDAWAKVENILNPDSNFSIITDLITVDTSGAVLGVSAPGTVYVIEGNAQIGVKYDDEVIKTYTVGVGQQFLVDQSGVESIEKGEEADVIFALSDQFKKTNWYRWNIKEDGAINAFEESDLAADEESAGAEDLQPETDDEDAEVDLANVGRVVYVTKPSKNTETNKSIISVEGKFDPEKINAVFADSKKATISNGNKWKVGSIELGFEGENEIKIEAEDLEGNKVSLDPLIVIYDKTPPAMPAVTEPGANDETIEIDDVEQLIEGTVSKDTAAVIVNDYRLTKYVPGSKEFRYYAKIEYGNLQAGENEYKIYAEDKAGNQSEPGMIILTLSQEVIDAADEESAGAEDLQPDTDDEDAEVDLANVGRVVYVTKPSKNTETNKSIISVEGKFDPEKINAVFADSKKATISNGNKWKVGSIELGFEGENEIKIEAEDLEGNKVSLDPLIVIYDKTPPAMPAVTEPGANDETIEIDDVEQLIEGTVSKDTAAVIVNDYRLTKYVPGSKEFRYYAKIEYGNLQAGENEYKIYAEDKAGNQSEPGMIILTLSQEVIDAADEESAGAEDLQPDTDDEDALPQASSSGGVTITAPNNGESFQTTETEFEITGTVPENTEKVVVNDYTLSLFEPGDTTFKYRAYASIGNLEIGEKNTYIIKAYDDADNLLGEASITIDVESGASAAPVITIPSATGSYTTSLDTIVLGGTVGKWVDRVYVNDKEISAYIPGSEEWRTSVSLSSGENTFVIIAEKDGSEVGRATIVVTYQP